MAVGISNLMSPRTHLRESVAKIGYFGSFPTVAQMRKRGTKNHIAPVVNILLDFFAKLANPWKSSW